MKKSWYFLFIFLFLTGISSPNNPSSVKPKIEIKKSNIPIFPSAVGFGAYTFAGSGRNFSKPKTTIYKITNLNALGKGSLLDCIKGVGPRVCVFEVSGIINLDRDIEINNAYLTIAGQTAPSPGISINGGGIKIQTHDVLLQHLSVRVGDRLKGSDPSQRDGIAIIGDRGAYNILVDHCSISWALDENFDIWYDKSFAITLSNSIVAEGLLDSLHKKGPHSMGALIGDGVHEVSIYHCLFAHNRERNPYLKPGVLVEVVNNVFYNWGQGKWTATNFSDYENTGKETKADIIGNYYKSGPETGDNFPLEASPAPGKGSKVFVKDNIFEKKTLFGFSKQIINSINNLELESKLEVFTPAVKEAKPAAEILPLVLSNVGSRPRQRDEVDLRIVDDVLKGKGNFKNCVSADNSLRCQNNASGWPILKENQRPLKLPTNPDSDDNKNGYTNLEEWLFGLAKELEVESGL